MKIYPAEPNTKTINELTSLSKEVIKLNYTSFLGTRSLKEYIQGERIAGYFKENIENTHILKNNGKILGFTVLKSNMIDLFMITTSEHRKGLGSRLLEYIEELIFDQWDMAVLESFTGNVVANNFYLNKGYQIVQEYHDTVNNVDKVIFEKKPTDQNAA